MERLNNLNRYQKGILILLVAMAILFCVLYSVTISKIGFLYNDKIFEVSHENGNTVYSGKIRGEYCKFVVSKDETVLFHAGENLYGPYKVKENSSAIPKDHAFNEGMTGIEVTDGEEIFFRGGILNWGNPGKMWFLVNEDGSDANMTITAAMSDGTIVDGDGNIVDPMEPSVTAILELLDGTDLTNKGDWQIWFYGLIRVLVYIAIARIVNTLVGIPAFMPTAVTAWISRILMAGMVFTMFKLAPANDRYKKTGIQLAIVLVLTIATELLNTGAVLTLIAGILSIVAEYQEYHGHSELIEEKDHQLSGKWTSLFMWSIVVGLILGFASTAAGVLAAVAGMDTEKAAVIIGKPTLCRLLEKPVTEAAKSDRCAGKNLPAGIRDYCPAPLHWKSDSYDPFCRFPACTQSGGKGNLHRDRIYRCRCCL